MRQTIALQVGLVLLSLLTFTATAAPTSGVSLAARDQPFQATSPAVAPPKDSKAFSSVLKAKRSLNIVLNNDDSWASANLRATYYALKAAGHNVVLVAPAQPQSGKGGTIVTPVNQTLTMPGAFNALPANAPFQGHDSEDENLHWFDGTPAAVTLWAIDQVKPFNGNIDLFVTGPNFGTNLGPQLYTLSGTIGAAYTATSKGFPAMAFSAFNSTQLGFQNLDYSNPNQEPIVIGRIVSDFVTEYGNTKSSGRLIPQGLGFNVNFSPIGSKGNCSRPDWIHSRITGQAQVDYLLINSTTNLPTYKPIVPDDGTGLNTCRGGHCRLPGETEVVGSGDCKAAVSIYNVDYTDTRALEEVNPPLNGAIKKLNSEK